MMRFAKNWPNFLRMFFHETHIKNYFQQRTVIGSFPPPIIVCSETIHFRPMKCVLSRFILFVSNKGNKLLHNLHIYASFVSFLGFD